MLATLAIVSFFPALVLAKQRQQACASDPFADPRHDPCNALLYIASNTLTGIAVALYLAVGISHAVSTWGWGARWMSAMTIGIFTYIIGLAFRFVLHTHPDSKGAYIVEYLFVVLSPCAFIAADYVLLGRLARHLNSAAHLLISPRLVLPIFIASDITTFLIQAAGGSVSIASNDLKTNKLGSNIFLAGLVVQLVSFFLFTCMYLRFLQRVYTRSKPIWLRDRMLPWYKDWRALAVALCISCVGILVRSVFRVIELSQGFKGPLATNEGAFYGLDTLPLFVAVSVYVPFWPGRFVRPQDEGRDHSTAAIRESSETKEESTEKH